MLCKTEVTGMCKTEVIGYGKLCKSEVIIGGGIGRRGGGGGEEGVLIEVIDVSMLCWKWK